MPMKLKIQDRCQIEADFLELMIDMWKERWTALNNEIKQADPRYRLMKVRDNGPTMAKLKAACTDRAAYDHELAQLYSLPFVHFWTLDHGGETWLAGLTRPITHTDLGSKRWQGPRYTIYIPRSVIYRKTDAPFHFVPEGNELTHYRHPHHKVRMEDSRWNRIEYPQGISNPLDYQPATCWGTFGTLATTCVRGGEFTNLFRTLYIYLTRIDEGSLLVSPLSLCTHIRALPSAVDLPARRGR